MTFIDRFNRRMATSAVGRFFRLEFSGHRNERKGSRFFTEIRAGLAT
jgi:AGZA family xanthine/uracil permease-like MFS transporter